MSYFNSWPWTQRHSTLDSTFTTTKIGKNYNPKVIQFAESSVQFNIKCTWMKHDMQLFIMFLRMSAFLIEIFVVVEFAEFLTC